MLFLFIFFWNTRSVCFVISVIFRVTVFSLVLLEKSSELAHSQSEEPKMEIIHLGQNQNQLVSNSLMADPRDSFNLGMGQSDYPKTVCQMDLPITDQTPKKTKYAINGSPESQEKTKKYLADCKKGLIKPICVPWDKEEYLVKRSGPFSSSEERVFSYPKISPDKCDGKLQIFDPQNFTHFSRKNLLTPIKIQKFHFQKFQKIGPHFITRKLISQKFYLKRF